jgi:hypothetical protein
MEGIKIFNVQTLIDEIVVKNNQVRSGQRDGAKFHISDAGGCYRARVFKRRGYQPTREIETPALRKMLAGSAGHDQIQKLLRYQGKLFLAESELETEHLKGHPDGVIKNGELVLLEIKTIEKFQMGYIKKQGAKRPHELQMFTYWSLLRKDLPELNRAVLSYIKREDFEAHDFYYNWSEEIQKQVDEEWNTLILYWTNNALPPCTCKDLYDGNGPKYCRYGITDKECCSELLYTKMKNETEIPRVMMN